VLLASWGAYDRNQLSRDRHRHGIRLPFGKGHLNIKAAFAERAGRPPMGMAQALRLCGLPLEGTHHRGIDDARNIAKLLPYAIGRVPIGSAR
jgi:inhibitor of KinA sporulation pathway (predicted exonuclease)